MAGRSVCTGIAGAILCWGGLRTEGGAGLDTFYPSCEFVQPWHPRKWLSRLQSR